MSEWNRRYCPNCKKYVYPVRHVYSDRVEYICPNCGRVLEVVHLEQGRRV